MDATSSSVITLRDVITRANAATSFTPPAGAILPSDLYVWNLRVLNGNTSGGPSTYLYFQAPAASVLPVPTVIGPGGSSAPGPVLNTLTPTFTWDAITTGGFTGYQLNLYNYTTSTLVIYQISGPSSNSFTLPKALPAGDTFVWNLRVVDGTVTGTESAYLNFQTPAQV